ncbi:AAA family ATPase [Sorangium sp. So ce887]|uniref:AAA family ATPase n=1 Tax=Sorangium sp. So ce887 TaxID=3133324 RepID=UPI003F5E579F
MLTLDSLSVANYRAFADPTPLELRPLTLLYGRNSAGKSALLRALPLIGDSVAEGASSPLDLSGDAGRGSSFHDLTWKGAKEDPYLRLSFSWPPSSALSRIEYGLDFSRERRITLVKEFSASDRAGSRVLHATHAPEPDEARANELHYDIVDAGQPEQRIRLDFVGLVPELCPEIQRLKALRERMLELRGAIQWLSALRRPPARLTPDQGSKPKRMSGSGEEAASILRSNPDIDAEVTRFYKERFGRSFAIVEVPPKHYRILLRPDPTMDVDLIDAGEGMMQLFPVLVAAAMARRHESGGPSILAIEEPESQLHPDAQRELAEHLCEIAAGPNPPRIVLETHSYPLLLSVQLEIARGRLPRERVLAYWVHQLEDHRSRAERVTFDDQGRPEGNWPPDVFADHRELARELMKAQLKGKPRVS